MTIISTLRRAPGEGLMKATCANCGTDVFESSGILNTAGSAWAGRCPACRALNYTGVGVAVPPGNDLGLELASVHSTGGAR